jgi:AcrR family transcriptional regulator
MSWMTMMSTPDLILNAAMELFSEKGYAAVTTKEIAVKAQVSEVTLFRYFETKKALYGRVFTRYVFEPSFDDVFHKQISGDLSKDLLNIASFFQDIIIKNKKLLQMSMKDSHEFVDSEQEDNFVKRFPLMVKVELISYFSAMKEKGVTTREPEILAVNFILINAGLLINLFSDGCGIEENQEKCRESMVDIFVKGIKA